jgi:hypothetical protein
MTWQFMTFMAWQFMTFMAWQFMAWQFMAVYAQAMWQGGSLQKAWFFTIFYFRPDLRIITY